MTVCRGAMLNVAVDPAKDVVFSHRNITFCIKVWDGPDDFDAVTVLYRRPDGTWQVPIPSEMNGEAPHIFPFWPEHAVKHSSLRQWVVAEFIPALNRWLAKVFPAKADELPPLPPNADIHEQLDALLVGKLRFVSKPDGTLVAQLLD